MKTTFRLNAAGVPLAAPGKLKLTTESFLEVEPGELDDDTAKAVLDYHARGIVKVHPDDGGPFDAWAKSRTPNAAVTDAPDMAAPAAATTEADTKPARRGR